MTVDDIVSAARAQSGLADFGDTAILEGLGILLQAYEEEAQFTEAGKQRAIGALISTLANRMRVEDWLNQHPELLERLAIGRPRQSVDAELRLLSDIGQAMRDASICGLGQTASSAIESAMVKFQPFRRPR